MGTRASGRSGWARARARAWPPAARAPSADRAGRGTARTWRDSSAEPRPAPPGRAPPARRRTSEVSAPRREASRPESCASFLGLAWWSPWPRDSQSRPDEPEDGHEQEQEREQREEPVVGDQRREVGPLVVGELVDDGQGEAEPAVPALAAVERSDESAGHQRRSSLSRRQRSSRPIWAARATAWEREPASSLR